MCLEDRTTETRTFWRPAAPTELARTQKNPNNSPIAQVFASVRPRKWSYMPDYGFIYYPLLSQPHHLQLG